MQTPTLFRLFVVGILALSAVLALLSLVPGVGWDDDYALYIMQAKALVSGGLDTLVRQNAFLTERSIIPPGPVLYPWGFPLMLAPVYAVRGLDIHAFKLVGVLSYLGFLVILAVWLRRKLSPVMAAAGLALFALNPTIIYYVNQIGSDLPFLCVSAAAVFLIEALIVGRESRALRPMALTILGVCLGFAAIIRTNGILLVATCALSHAALALAARRRRGTALKVAWQEWLPYAACAVMMMIVAMALPSGEMSHLDGLRRVTWRTIAGAVPYYVWVLADFYSGVPCAPFICGVSLVFVLIGIAVRLRSDFHLLLYAGMTMMLYLLWPARQGVRFIYPVLPVYVFFMLTGIEESRFGLKGIAERCGRYLGFLFLGGILVCFAFRTVSFAGRNIHHQVTMSGPFDRASSEMFDFVKSSTAPDALFASGSPRAFRLLTGREALWLNHTRTSEKVDYVVTAKHLGPEWQLKAGRSGESGQGSVTNVFENESFCVYRLREPGAGEKKKESPQGLRLPH
jgi:hypothetical protein